MLSEVKRVFESGYLHMYKLDIALASVNEQPYKTDTAII